MDNSSRGRRIDGIARILGQLLLGGGLINGVVDGGGQGRVKVEGLERLPCAGLPLLNGRGLHALSQLGGALGIARFAGIARGDPGALTGLTADLGAVLHGDQGAMPQLTRCLGGHQEGVLLFGLLFHLQSGRVHPAGHLVVRNLGLHDLNIQDQIVVVIIIIRGEQVLGADLARHLRDVIPDRHVTARRAREDVPQGYPIQGLALVLGGASSLGRRRGAVLGKALEGIRGGHLNLFWQEVGGRHLQGVGSGLLGLLRRGRCHLQGGGTGLRGLLGLGLGLGLGREHLLGRGHSHGFGLINRHLNGVPGHDLTDG